MSDELPHQLTAVRDAIHRGNGTWDATGLAEGCDEATRVAGFGGDPGSLRAVAGNHGQVLELLDLATRSIAQAATAQLEVVSASDGKTMVAAAWTGDTQVAAKAALDAVQIDIGRAGEALRAVRLAVDEYAKTVEDGLRGDAAATDDLARVADFARRIAPLQDEPAAHADYLAQLSSAHGAAMQAIDDRVREHTTVRDAGEELGADLHDRAAKARARRFAGAGAALSAVDEVTMAMVGGPAEMGLTPAQEERAANALAGLNDADRLRITTLLAGSDSLGERAYLLKALAAGYSADEVAAFDALIRPHAGDLRWLDEHLSPLAMDGGGRGRQPNRFGDRLWTQGTDPTCVASSTVAARAEVDPLFALQLTTGGHPGDPLFDNPDAFARRLHDEQYRVYDDGRNVVQKFVSWLPLGKTGDGMNTGQSRTVADQEIGRRTGARYDNVSLGDDSRQRTRTLRAVERAADDGYPVPLSVDGDGRHQMMVIGHEDGKIEIYNPWGYTYWVSESDFVGGHVSPPGSGVPPHPVSVRLPEGYR